jgi:hypothetical protein
VLVNVISFTFSLLASRKLTFNNKSLPFYTALCDVALVIDKVYFVPLEPIVPKVKNNFVSMESISPTGVTLQII